MGQPDRGIRCIDALASVAGRAHNVDADIFFGNINDNILIHFGDHSDRDRRGVDPSA